MSAVIEDVLTTTEQLPNDFQHFPGTILVVDDVAVDRRLVGQLVEKITGLRVLYASNGKEALEMVKRSLPLAILTDLQMPKMDGLELVEEMRCLHPGIPVVLMTALGSEEIAVEALKSGAASYL